MDVRLPDGTVVTNVPEGITQSELLARVGKAQPKKAEESHTSFSNLVGAATEPLLQLGTGALAAPVSGLAGILATLTQGLGLSKTDPADVVRSVGGAMTYEPKTEGGKNASSVIMAPLHAIGEAADYAGGKTTDITGSPDAGVLANVIVQAIPAILGAKAAKVNKEAVPVVNRAAEGAAKVAGYVPNKFADVINNVTGPLRETWRTEQGRRFVEDMTGKDQIPAVREMVKNAESIIPNSPMTTADRVAQGNMGADKIVGSPVIAIENRLAGLPGGISDIAKSIDATQSGLRKGAIDEIAQTKEALADAVKKRSINAKINYQQAYENIVKSDPVLEKLTADPYFNDAKVDAIKEAKHRGIDPEKNSTEFLQIVKMSLDGELGKVGESSLKNMQKSSVADVKGQLLDWMDKKNPDYAMARKGFASDSVPVNQMELGQSLQPTLTGATGKERQLAFNSAVEKAKNTIDKDSNRPVFDDLNPKQKESVQRVTDELTRDVLKGELGANQKVDSVFQVAEKGKGGVSLPALLSKPATITNWIMKRMGHGADELIAKDMGRMMLENPEGFASKYLADKPRTARERLVANLMRNREAALGATIGANEK